MDAAPTTSRAALAPAAARRMAADYLALTKPKVQSLLLLTTITTMLVAGDPSVGLIALTCLGGYLSAGGAGAANHWDDPGRGARGGRTGNPAAASGGAAARAGPPVGPAARPPWF